MTHPLPCRAHRPPLSLEADLDQSEACLVHSVRSGGLFVFLDALASLVLMLSLGQWVIFFSDFQIINDNQWWSMIINNNIYFGHLSTWCKNIWLQVYRYKKMQLKQQEQDTLNCPWYRFVSTMENEKGLLSNVEQGNCGAFWCGNNQW